MMQQKIIVKSIRLIKVHQFSLLKCKVVPFLVIVIITDYRKTIAIVVLQAICLFSLSAATSASNAYQYCITIHQYRVSVCS